MHIKQSDLALYDFCRAVDDHREISALALAQHFRCTLRNIDRRLSRLKELDMPIERVNVDGDWVVRLTAPIEAILASLDKAFGMRPHSQASTLSKDKQAEVLDIYGQLLNGKRTRWPNGYLTDPEIRQERLRVVLPYAKENIIQREFNDMYRKHTRCAKLAGVRRQYYGDSNYRMFVVAYPWLKPWEMGGKPLHIWQGKEGKKNAREAIRWLVEDILELSLLSLPRRIRKTHFQEHHLGGLLRKMFSDCPYRAITFAYPRRYKKEEFIHCRNA